MRPSAGSELDGTLRRAGALSLGRQVGALAFLAAVCVLPRLAARPVVDAFVWAYFAALFLTSILNLGLERVAAPVVARRHGATLRATLRPILMVRVGTVPISAAALWVLYRFVGVTLPSLGWVLSLCWIVAVQVQGVVFAGLRAVGEIRFEARAAAVSRLIEAAALTGLAAAGLGITAILGAMAVIEAGVAVMALAHVDGGPSDRRSVAALPWHSICMYTGVELLAFTYLRVDTALVGHLLGPGPGATYGLIYRVIDGMTGLATPILLVLFPLAAQLVSAGQSLDGVRERALRVLPAGAVVLAVTAVFLSSPLAALVPRFGDGLHALRLLIVTVPIYFANAIELHLRSAENRNRQVLVIGAMVLGLNIGLNLLLVPRYGLVGAASALVLTEGVQLVAILLSESRGARPVRPWRGAIVAYLVVLTVVAMLLNAGAPWLAALLGVGLLVAVGRSSRVCDVRPLLAAR